MNDVLKKLDDYNCSFKLEISSFNRMQLEDHEKQKLNNLQQYELYLNQCYLTINTYPDLDTSIINWGSIEEFNISQHELIAYIEERLLFKLSIDRIYFFNELLFYFCNKKQKKHFAKKVLISLKQVVFNNMQTDYDVDLILRLFARFFIVSERYSLYDEEFVMKVNQNYFKNIDVESDFYFTLYFFNYIFQKYNNQMHYYKHFLNMMNQFSKLTDENLLSKSYNPQRSYAADIASIYNKINDYEQKIYFYKKEIDNTLEHCKDISRNNAMIYQSILKENMNYAEKASYKMEALKNLYKNVSNYIAEHYQDFFHSIHNEELEKHTREYYETVEQELEKENSIQDKIDYIVFYIFHFTYYSKQYEKHLEDNKKGGFSIRDLFSSTRVDHKGYSHAVKDKQLFNYFNMCQPINNNLFLYLDHKLSWVSLSSELIQENINEIKIIDEYKLQFTKAVNYFSDNQYMEFMYMSPILIEILLKQYLYQINGDVMNSRNLSVEKTLSPIIKELIKNDNCYIDKNILKYISYIMVENVGMNIRNEILHGNYKDGYFNIHQAMNLYIILIYLIRYFKNDQD